MTASVLAALGAVRGARSVRRRRYLVGCGILVALLVAAIVVALCVGERVYSPAEVLRVLLGQQVPGASFTVGRLRLPRVLTGLLVGAAFGLGGIVFQTLLRNSLAAPDVIGITSGASAGAVFAIVVLRWSGAPVTLVAVAGALLVSALIYLVAYQDGLSPTRLVLVGIAVAAMGTGLISYLLLRANTFDLQAAMRWLTGSLDSSFWTDLPPLALTMVVLVPVLGVLASRLRILQLGDQSATALGLGVERTRFAIILVAVLLLAVATSVTGPIAFVAFLAGPIAVRVVRGGGLLVPSALVGSLLVVGGDIAATRLLPVAYPVGAVTGAVGGAYLLWLLARSSRSGGSL